MTDDQDDSTDEEEAGPTVELGEGTPVEGAPLARVAARLTWPQEKSEVVRKEGDAVIRTPEGPQSLEDVLDGVETTYFGRRQDFVDAVRGVVGTGPIPSAE